MAKTVLRNILAVGAHPDDIELGCGGTLMKKIKEGYNTYAIVLTKGEKGLHCPASLECKKSASMLGIKGLHILDFKDTHVPNDGRVVSVIESYVKKYNPEIIYGHTPNDRHQDHRNASLATQSAGRGVPKLLLFECPSSTVDFVPHYFEIINESIDDKIRALKNYRTQLERDSIFDIDWVKYSASYWGFKNRKRGDEKTYAEAFELNHFLNL